MPTKTMTPTEAYEQAAASIAKWEGELAAAREQIAAMEAAPVTDAAAAKKQAGQLATARESSYRCARALDDAIDARNAAAVAVVEREATDMQPAIDAAAEALREHDAHTAELLEPLRAHSGGNGPRSILCRSGGPVVAMAG